MPIDDIKKVILPILQAHGATRVGLFGSVTRDELQDSSDIDILVDLKKDLNLFGFIAIKQQLEETLRRRVDLVEYSALKPRLKDNILKQQIRLL